MCVCVFVCSGYIKQISLVGAMGSCGLSRCDVTAVVAGAVVVVVAAAVVCAAAAAAATSKLCNFVVLMDSIWIGIGLWCLYSV